MIFSHLIEVDTAALLVIAKPFHHIEVILLAAQVSVAHLGVEGYIAWIIVQAYIDLRSFVMSIGQNPHTRQLAGATVVVGEGEVLEQWKAHALAEQGSSVDVRVGVKLFMLNLIRANVGGECRLVARKVF